MTRPRPKYRVETRYPSGVTMWTELVFGGREEAAKMARELVRAANVRDVRVWPVGPGKEPLTGPIYTVWPSAPLGKWDRVALSMLEMDA